MVGNRFTNLVFWNKCCDYNLWTYEEKKYSVLSEVVHSVLPYVPPSELSKRFLPAFPYFIKTPSFTWYTYPFYFNLEQFATASFPQKRVRLISYACVATKRFICSNMGVNSLKRWWSSLLARTHRNHRKQRVLLLNSVSDKKPLSKGWASRGLEGKICTAADCWIRTLLCPQETPVT